MRRRSFGLLSEEVKEVTQKQVSNGRVVLDGTDELNFDPVHVTDCRH